MSQDRADIGIDARLRRALAHAPDAQIEPPAALDEAILRAAHAARPMPAAMAASRESRGFFAPLKRWWAHPAAAPVFAVLALSTVIVSMWSGRVPAPTIAEDESPVAAAPMREQDKVAPASPAGGAVGAATASANPVSTPAAAAPTVPITADPAAAAPPSEVRVAEGKAREDVKVRSQAVPNAQAAPKRNQTRGEGADQLADKKLDAALAKDALRRARQEAAAGQREVDRDERVAPSDASPAAAADPTPALAPPHPQSPSAQPSTAQPQPQPQAPPPSSTRSNEEGRATASATVPPSAAEQGSAAAPAVAKAPTVGSAVSTLSSRAAAAPNRDDASREARVAAAADAPPFARAFDAPATWQWRADPTQPLAPIDDRARAWFARLVAASQGRWVRADDGAQAQHAADARMFELWRDQAPWATIVMGPSDATWVDASGRRWRAALPADVLAALRSW